MPFPSGIKRTQNFRQSLSRLLISIYATSKGWSFKTLKIPSFPPVNLIMQNTYLDTICFFEKTYHIERNSYRNGTVRFIVKESTHFENESIQAYQLKRIQRLTVSLDVSWDFFLLLKIYLRLLHRGWISALYLMYLKGCAKETL